MSLEALEVYQRVREEREARDRARAESMIEYAKYRHDELMRKISRIVDDAKRNRIHRTRRSVNDRG